MLENFDHIGDTSDDEEREWGALISVDYFEEMLNDF
jgi:hypothetical protein